MSEKVTILGAGSWGMAIARLLDLNDHRVTLWEFDVAESKRLAQMRTIPEKLPRLKLADSIAVTSDLEDSLVDSSEVVLAVPAQVVRPVLKMIPNNIARSVGLVNLAKGIEAGSLYRVSEIVAEETMADPERFVVLSGPSHAEEVSADMPTTVVAAGLNDSFVEHIQQMFVRPEFRVYKSSDLVGVELGGALKNIIAIAAGIASGLKFGDNTMGALLTRGLAEISRLGMAAGAKGETFAGLSGLGDLVTTCTSPHSRNRHVGCRIAMGEKLPQIVKEMAMVAEGVETTRSGYALAEKLGVEVPIITEVYRVLFDDKPPEEALGDLMGRSLKAEMWK